MTHGVLLAQISMLLLLIKTSPTLCQELVKKAEVIGSNPSIVRITFEVTLPISLRNANLTGNISQWLEVESVQNVDGVVTRTGEMISVNFNTTIQAGQTFFSYNVTFPLETEPPGPISLTSVLTYFTSINNEIFTNSSEDTICLQRELKVVNRDWYIAIVLFASILVGFLISLLILWIIQQQCSSPFLGGGRAVAGKKQKDDKEANIDTSSFSSNETDLAHVIATDDAEDSARLIELCEINDITSAENRLQWGKATLLFVLLESTATERKAKNDHATLRKEIQKSVDASSKESQIEMQKASEKNQKFLSSVRRKQEAEIESLKTQFAGLSTEAQDELLSLANERHKLELKEEEHVFVLKLKEAENKGKNSNDMKCSIICDKLDALFEHQDKSYPSAIKDGYSLLLERINQLLETEGARSRARTSWRKSEVAKIRSYEQNMRRKWNRYAKTLVEAVKTICRELQLEQEIRKNLTSMIKEEMLKLKGFFDQEMGKERMDFLKTCTIEKSKLIHKTKTDFSSKAISNHAISWMTENTERIEFDMEKVAQTQKQYEIFVIDLWNRKFQVILQETAGKLKTLKDDLVQKLAQNGASRRSVEEFFTDETKDDTIDIARDTVTTEVDPQVSENKAKAKEVILQSHHEVLRIFLESQPFPTEKASEKLKVNLKNVHHHRKTKQSLQRIRELIHYHTEAAKKKNMGPKQKLRKRFSKSEDSIKKRLENQLEKWRKHDDSLVHQVNTSANVADFRNDMLSLEENLSRAVSSELSNQMAKKSKLELLCLDLNALERLMITLLKLLTQERKLSPAECNVVLQEHKNQTTELQKSSSIRIRRRLDQVVRKRLHSPRPIPFTKEEDSKDSAESQVLHHLNSTRNATKNAIRKIREDSEAGKEKFEILTQLNEQQASELRELDLKVVHALSKLAKVSSSEMRACLTLLLHHREQNEIQPMVEVIYSGTKDDGKEKSNFLPAVREMISQQKHRLAENLLRTDEDFAPSPLRVSNRLQRIKQPHHVAFIDTTFKRDRLSPLPDIRPEPVGRTSTPDLDYHEHQTTIYSNFDQPAKPTRRRKKKSLKNLSVAR